MVNDDEFDRRLIHMSLAIVLNMVEYLVVLLAPVSYSEPLAKAMFGFCWTLSVAESAVVLYYSHLWFGEAPCEKG